MSEPTLEQKILKIIEEFERAVMTNSSIINYQFHVMDVKALLDEKNAEIERLTKQVSDIRRAYSEEVRDMARDARNAIAEARWEERQGADYGSY